MESSKVTTPDTTDDPLECFPRIRLLSPCEMDYAFVAAAYRDREDPDKMDEWRTVCFVMNNTIKLSKVVSSNYVGLCHEEILLVSQLWVHHSWLPCGGVPGHINFIFSLIGKTRPTCPDIILIIVPVLFVLDGFLTLENYSTAKKWVRLIPIYQPMGWPKAASGGYAGAADSRL